MTMDRTLKTRSGLSGKRSVLTRAERIALLTEEEKFTPEADSPLGLPKVRVKVSRAGMKAKKAAEEAPAEGAEGAEGAAKTEAAAKPDAGKKDTGKKEAGKKEAGKKG